MLQAEGASRDTFFPLVWAQVQQFAALVAQQTPPVHSAAAQQVQQQQVLEQTDASSSLRVALMHYLFILQFESDCGPSKTWQPGCGEFRLVADLMLQGVRCIEDDTSGTFFWTQLVMVMIELFLTAYNHSLQPAKLDDTAAPAALALVMAGERLLAALPPAALVDTSAAQGASSTLVMSHVINNMLTTGTCLLVGSLG